MATDEDFKNFKDSLSKFIIYPNSFIGKTAIEISTMGFELGIIFAIVISKLSGEISFHSESKKTVLEFCDKMNVQYEIKDHDDMPIIVIKQ